MVRALAVAAVLAVEAAAQCGDPLDSTLCVYRLSPADSASFSTTDGSPSAFWANWAGRDSIELTADRNCCSDIWCGCMRHDNRVTVKAGCDASGLYIFVLVHDSVVLDGTASEDWGTDAVDMYFDALPSAVLDTCTTCMLRSSTSLAYTSFQQQTWLGNGTVPGESRLATYCNDFWWVDATCTCAWGQCSPPCGLRQEVVVLSDSLVALEYYVSWQWYSDFACHGLPADLAGRRLGFSIGYNDRDSGGEMVTCLRWQHGDPWTLPEPGESHWGDLLLPDDLPALAVTQPRRAAAQPAAAVPTQRYTLTGRLLTSRRAQASRGVVVEQRLHRALLRADP